MKVFNFSMSDSKLPFLCFESSFHFNSTQRFKSKRAFRNGVFAMFKNATEINACSPRAAIGLKAKGLPYAHIGHGA